MPVCVQIISLIVSYKNSSMYNEGIRTKISEFRAVSKAGSY